MTATEFDPKYMAQDQNEPTQGESAETECPTCGRDDFKSPVGMKQHHKSSHGESIAGVEVECAVCGTTKRTEPHKTNRNSRHFCDNGCWAEWKESVTIAECEYCGKEKEMTATEMARWTRPFCSPECHQAWQRENIEPVTVKCHSCGRQVTKDRRHLVEYDRHFCDKSCWGVWMSENLHGNNHPRWSGGGLPYGEGWTEVKREHIRERQNRRCAGCGTHESGLPTRLHVHHIVPARSFDDAEPRNDESNLVALCRSCHNQWEKMSPLRPNTAEMEP